jgi:23S rRNA pseudouridine1911/1915/1917 synthase
VHRKKMAVRQDGRFAATGWRVLERFTNGMCLAELGLETGRTHQIRVHMASLGCPVAGDQLYGGKAGSSYGVVADRQMLHASTLVFFHPESGRELSFSAPLWADMAEVLQQLRSGVVS